MTSSALFYYSLGMIGFGLRQIISRGFYSLQDTKTSMINAALSMGLNIVLNYHSFEIYRHRWSCLGYQYICHCLYNIIICKL
ncbi:hypothetical protein NSA47_13990 [Irregularibacter muris]|uniref:Uncharacterized protein n=2 Tax=Irregularibacter muris TaxID=1796619 RepID=A0AAE3L015_9FIRM|nr:hypothetical protein [Irregularibacter muris]